MIKVITGDLKENTIAMADINLKAILDTLEKHGIAVSQDVKDMINAYGNMDPLKVIDFIKTVYTFINDVLSGYYDTMVMELDIFYPLFHGDVNDPQFNNGYIRNINWKEAS